MHWLSGIMVYVVIWWLTLFFVLPWGNRPPDDPEPGHATSAPETPRLALKFAVTTALAAVFFVIFYAVYESGWIDFRNIPE